MHWGADWQSGWFLGMHLAWWIFWIIVAVVSWAAVTRLASSQAPKAESPLEVLGKRYAEGGLTTEEYEERKARLTETGAATHSRPGAA